MSSAISSLKKMKKNPLPGTVPFRNAATPNSGISDENQLLEEVTSQMAATRLKDLHTQSVINVVQRPTNRRTSMDTKNVPSDHELMMLMTSRIKNLETRLQFQGQTLADRDKKIKILEDKLTILKKSRVEGSSEKLNQLERKCLLLQQQVYEMEAFLAEYGMIWVGDKTNPDSSVYLDEDADASDSEGRTEDAKDPKYPSTWKPAESVASGEFFVDYNLFVRNINELNVVAGEGISKIHRTVDGARLRLPDPIQLTLYSNGLLMFDGPFRPFSDPQTQDLVKDVIDGYFPSELQGRFPEGVPFKFTDKQNIVFKDKRTEVFQGEGQILGGETTSRSRLVPSSASKDSKSRRSSNAPVETEIPGRKLTMEQFLNKIPKSVVKNGRLIDIRNSLQETITGNDAKSGPGIVTVVDTPQLRELKGRLELDEAERPPSSRQITTLRVKSELGDQTYILKMRFTDTIGDLRKYLNKERGANKSIYKIMSAFPKTVFDDDQATLHECGLTPNATLHLLATN